MNKQRKCYTGEEKMAILRPPLVERETRPVDVQTITR